MGEIDIEVLDAHLAALTFRAVGALPHEAEWLYAQTFDLPIPTTPEEAMLGYIELERRLWAKREEEEKKMGY